jgi:hypothetical protein
MHAKDGPGDPSYAVFMQLRRKVDWDFVPTQRMVGRSPNPQHARTVLACHGVDSNPAYSSAAGR